MALKRARTPDAQQPSQTFRSAPVEDRSSIFTALFSATISPSALQAESSIETATHRILAWRKPSAQRSIGPVERLCDTGHDDDGEKYAGKKLEQLLESMNVEGAVVVARWYGGVMLGPIRFAHMERVAREAILKASQRPASEHLDEGVKRARTTQNEDDNRMRLAKILKERDSSILVLRALLAEKGEGNLTGKGKGKEMRIETPKKSLDYGAMPLAVLLRLEKARDATISWILKEIDKIEDEQKTLVDKPNILKV